MNKKLVTPKILFFIATLLTAGLGSSRANSSPEPIAMLSARLYKSIKSKKNNFCFSPYSISTLFEMAYEGAHSTTKKELADAFKFSKNSGLIREHLAQIESGGHVKLTIANSLWPQQGDALKGDFVSRVRKTYRGEIKALDFSTDPEAARHTINQWVEQKTDQKIMNVIPVGGVTKLTRFVMANAVYFKGAWNRPFDRRSTEDGTFYIDKNRQTTVPFMQEKFYLRFKQGKDFQVVDLPYAGREIVMTLILPTAQDGLAAVESQLESNHLDTMLNGMAESEVFVSMPRFKFSCEPEIQPTLETLGVRAAFQQTTADFSGIDGKPNWLFISKVLHKTYIDVNEAGTEAAATTVATMMGGTARQATEFKADHPFIFLIREPQQGTILFIGRVTDPSSAD